LKTKTNQKSLVAQAIEILGMGWIGLCQHPDSVSALPFSVFRKEIEIRL
jgi:hypothetical protein